MKKFIVLTALVIILLPLSEAKPQDPIDLYDGIPLVIYPDLRVIDIDTIYASPYQQMEDMGVFGVVAGDVLDNSIYLQHFTDHNVKVIPQYLWGDLTKSHILRYTDAHYTVWEAEGTDPTKGNATLSYSSQTSYFSELYQGETIEGRSAGGFSGPIEIISGPGYPQNIKYRFFDNAFIQYFGEYRMKITQRDPNLPLEYSNDVVCILKVTALDAQGNIEFPVATEEVTVAEFNGWNNWTPIQVDEDGYNFEYLPVNYQQEIDGANQESPVFNASYIQFKVIWTGLPYLNLFIDRVRVYDEKGWQLKNISQPTNQIKILVNTYITDSTVVGWYGLDEPRSIDNYEPYRVVDSIVDSVSRYHNKPMRLHTGFTAGYQGRYGDLATGAHPLFPAEEFWLRARPKNVQINMYNYNYPYASNPGHPDYNPLWRTKNIEYVTDYYLDRINDFDTNFAFSTQSGKFGSSVPGESIIPSPSQINYHVNLGLMYGDKELRLDPFFSDASRDLVGLINMEGEETENYYFFKDLLIPRLNGLLGKTLRQIHQMAQYPNINPSVGSDLNINAIKKIKLDYPNVTEAMPSFIDLGFFSKEGFEPNRYFMIINRYYSDTLLNKFKIDFRNLSGFYNWSLMNYVDSSNTTIIANETGFVTSPQFQINRGDAILFSLFPVAEFGGKLLVSENVGEGMTLTGDLSIESGATLTINGTYYAKANITVKSGGKIVAGPNGKIIFDAGKQLIIEGSALINGTTLNRLTLEFGTETLEGIVVKPNAALYINYCDVKNAKTAISAKPGSGQINISNVNFTNFNKAGIVLLGYQGDGPITPPPPIIFNCNFFGSPVGVSVSNYN